MEDNQDYREMIVREARVLYNKFGYEGALDKLQDLKMCDSQHSSVKYFEDMEQEVIDINMNKDDVNSKISIIVDENTDSQVYNHMREWANISMSDTTTHSEMIKDLDRLSQNEKDIISSQLNSELEMSNLLMIPKTDNENNLDG